jgi:hypothetical protein
MQQHENLNAAAFATHPPPSTAAVAVVFSSAANGLSHFTDGIKVSLAYLSRSQLTPFASLSKQLHLNSET